MNPPSATATDGKGQRGDTPERGHANRHHLLRRRRFQHLAQRVYGHVGSFGNWTQASRADGTGAAGAAAATGATGTDATGAAELAQRVLPELTLQVPLEQAQALEVAEPPRGQSARRRRSVSGQSAAVEQSAGAAAARPRTLRSGVRNVSRAIGAAMCQPRPTAHRRAPAALRGRIQMTTARRAAAREMSQRRSGSRSARGAPGDVHSVADATSAGSAFRSSSASGRPSTRASATMPSCITSTRCVEPRDAGARGHRHARVLPQPLAAVQPRLLDRGAEHDARRSPRARRS